MRHGDGDPTEDASSAQSAAASSAVATTTTNEDARDGRRVILLLDLDCFYAQCEIVRLGLDRAIPLALLQWDSALAVNYPARALGIKRGDSFTTIRSKGEGRCVALHLPVIPVRGVAHVNRSPAKLTAGPGGEDPPRHDHDSGDSSLREAYDASYRLPAVTRNEEFRRERNRMRHPSEGKASLERYRLASSMIFAVVMETLSSSLGRGKFILERASIDELFLDVSEHCYNLSSPFWADENASSTATPNSMLDIAKEETVVCGSRCSAQDPDDYETRALWRGCAVARGIRRAVHESLGFTLSAGISTSKLVAKLGAGYGKPNGQAVIFPSAFAEVMEETPIKKVRNLGGKIGKKVLSLLPEGEQTMGSISRLLSVSDLSKALGNETGKFVLNASKGLDEEEVKETAGALTKSITAYKSFHRTDLAGLRKWISLLANDVVARVEQDTRRNSRFPKSCTIHYVHSAIGGSDWIAKSVRIPFPKESEHSVRLKELEQATCNALESKGHFPIRRLGLSAVDFDTRPKLSIKSFFVGDATSSSKARKNGLQCKSSFSVKAEPKGPDEQSQVAPKDDKQLAKALQDKFDREDTEGLELKTAVSCSDPTVPVSPSTSDKKTSLRAHNEPDEDLAYAQKLQATFDRENRVLSSLERKVPTGQTKREQWRSPLHADTSHDFGSAPQKKNKIDHFFSSKKK